MIRQDEAWSALGGVFDPELDRPITDLGFVAALQINDDSSVRAELRLPTYFCAPNFAWLMVADARDALATLPGVTRVDVVLLEHFVSAEINAGVAAVSDFSATLEPGALDPDLAELRSIFERKAHLAAQDLLARALVAAGAAPGGLAGVSVAEGESMAPAEMAGVLRRRSRLGVSSAFALCDDDGTPLREDRLPGWLRFARTVRVSIEGNAGFCRGLLETRYGLEKVA